MSVQNIVILGLIFGMISTLCVHLGKAMERHGIETFKRGKKLKEKGKKPLIYFIGVIFNQSVVLWQIIAMQYTSAAVFASVFGLGLVLLMLYSHFILHEDIHKPEILGSILIIIGTTMIGFIQVIEPPNAENVNYDKLYFALIIFMIIFMVLILTSAKTRIGVAVIFGVVAGIFAGLDNIFKRIGLKEGILNVGNSQTLPIFIISFVLANLAFVICQIAFAKDADASKLVPIYNSFYIAFPILFELIIYDGYYVSPGKIIALSIIITGIFCMQSFKDPHKSSLESGESHAQKSAEIQNISEKNSKIVVSVEQLTKYNANKTSQKQTAS